VHPPVRTTRGTPPGGRISAMTSPAHPRVATVARLLTETGGSGEVRMLPAEVRTAAALDVPVGAIVNSLVFEAAGSPVLILTSGAHRVDAPKVAALLGVAEVTPARAEFVRHHTGQVIGGVAPIGHPEPIGTLVDVELARYDVVWASAGHPASVFPTSYEELLRLTAGTAAEVGNGPNEAGAVGTVAQA
jgi:prolyl-tRNA editing enzyme YbaK/EbsC (Cys-tRNA(Pro) deacylase)